MPEFKLGKDAKCYFGTARASWGTLNADGYAYEGAAPSGLTVIDKLSDLTLSINKDSADVTTRANNGWKANASTLKDGEITGAMVYEAADAGVVAIMKSFFVGSVLPMAILDGDKGTAGVEGLWADFEVMGLEKGEPIAGAQTLNVTLKPTLTTVPPQWVRVTA